MASAATPGYIPLKPSWERVVKLPQTSQQWIKEYGLKANKLTWSQVAAKLGFKKQSGRVGSVGHTVESKYGDGVFTQFSAPGGQLYQLTAPLQKIEEVEHQLLSVVTKLKSRLKWLQSGSRLMFGVLLEKRPVLVVDSAPSHAGVTTSVAARVVQEQCVHTQCFSLIHCCNGVEEWQPKMATPSPESIDSALEWLRLRSSTSSVGGAGPNPTHPHTLRCSILAALNKALSYAEADSIYLVTHDNRCMEIHTELVAMAKKLPIPLHVVAIDCKSSDTLSTLKELAGVTQGRCHAYQSQPGQGPTLTQEDVVLLSEELDLAKMSLAEVQALRLEMRELSRRDQEEGPSPREVKCEDFMTSAEWLSVHGVRRKGLCFSDLVASLAFRHCDGVLCNPAHQAHSEVGLVPAYEIIQAKYCHKFVHLRWKDGGVVHINLTKRMADSFQQRLEQVTAQCRERMSWLRQGSRELFGTILEECVVLVIDTSSSMGLHLPLVKHKFAQLVQEQLCHKREFTVLQYSTGINPWRPRLVPVSAHTLDHAKQWVESLQAAGTSNLLDVLRLATTLPHVQGVYVLTDGRPDQSPSTVLAARQSWPSIPIHTISFNCADTQANHFLAQLASDSGGRYHYFADGPEDRHGPVPYKSVDMQQLLDEVSFASHQLVQVQQLATECEKLRDTPTRSDTGQDTKDLSRGAQGDGRHTGDDEMSSSTSVEGAMATGEGAHRRDSSIASETSGGVIKHKAKSLLSSKRWLQSNSLAAKGLTLVDALGPSAVPVTPSKPLPHSGARVYGKVLRKAMPVRHMSSEGRVTLVHPTHPDVRAFKDRLLAQCAVYRTRLNSLAKAALQADDWQELQCSLGGGEGGVEYMDHKEAVLEAVARAGWRRRKEDFDLLEQELLQAEKAVGFLDSVLSASLNRDNDSDIISMASDSDTGSNASSAVDQLSPSESHTSFTASLHSSPCSSRTLPSSARGSGLQLGEAALAQDPSDGFFYKGRITSGYRGRKVVVVEFADGDKQEVKKTRVIPVGGARPAPVLKEGCCVLVRVRSRHSTHWESHGLPCDIHIPGTILKAPTHPQLSSAFYTVMAYNKKPVMCTRRHVHPISNKQFEVFTHDICDLQRVPVEQEGGAGGTDMPSTLPSAPSEEGTALSKVTQGAEVNDKGEESGNVKKGGQSRSPLAGEVELDPTGRAESGHLKAGVAQQVQLEGEGDREQAAWRSGAVVDVGTQATEVCERACSPLPMVWDVAVNTVDSKSGDCPGNPPLHRPVEDRGTCTEWPVDDQPPPAVVVLRSEEEEEGGGRQSGGFGIGAAGTDCDKSEHTNMEAAEKSSSAFCPPQSSTPIPPEQGKSELVLVPSDATSIVTEHVLAKWSTDGWYRKGLVVRDNKDGRYLVMDDFGDSDMVAVNDLVLVSREPFQRLLPLGSFVVAPHPEYQGVYGPAQVTAHIFEDQYVLLMFDGRAGRCARREMFLVSEERYTRDVEGIAAKQQEWVGQVVVARNNEDGFFYHGTVQQYSSGHFSIMSLQDGFLDTQKSDHVFGPAQKRRVIQCKDHIVAFESGSTTSVGVPGRVTKCVGGKLDVELCHGARWTEVESSWCYWVSESYYHDSIDYILQCARENEGSLITVTDTE